MPPGIRPTTSSRKLSPSAGGLYRIASRSTGCRVCMAMTRSGVERGLVGVPERTGRRRGRDRIWGIGGHHPVPELVDRKIDTGSELIAPEGDDARDHGDPPRRCQVRGQVRRGAGDDDSPAIGWAPPDDPGAPILSPPLRRPITPSCRGPRATATADRGTWRSSWPVPWRPTAVSARSPTRRGRVPIPPEIKA